MYRMVCTCPAQRNSTAATMACAVPKIICSIRSRGCQCWKQSPISSGPRRAGVASVANLQRSVNAIPDYFKHQQSGVLLSNKAKSLDCLGTSGGHLLAAVSSPNEPGHEDLAPCPYRALLH